MNAETLKLTPEQEAGIIAAYMLSMKTDRKAKAEYDRIYKESTDTLWSTIRNLVPEANTCEKCFCNIDQNTNSVTFIVYKAKS